MEYKNENLKVSFTVPDKITVRQQLNYFSEAALAVGGDLFVQLWLGARTIIQDWQCETLDLKADIDTLTDPNAVSVMIWASLRAKEHMDGLETVPKNS